MKKGKGVNDCMKQLFDELVQVSSTLYDQIKILEILARGLEAQGEYKSISIVDMQRRIMNMILKDLQTVLERIDMDELT